MTRRTNIPKIPQNLPKDIRTLFDKLRQAVVELQTKVEAPIDGKVIKYGTVTEQKIDPRVIDKAYETRYYIEPTNGTTIKNSTGSLTIRAIQIDGTGTTALTSGNVKMFKPDGTIAGNGYTWTAGAADISDSIVITLKDDITKVEWDTVSLVDITDGGDGTVGAVEASNGLVWTRAIDAGVWSPAATTTDLTATFYTGGVSVATRVVRVTRDANGILTGALDSSNGEPTSHIITGSGSTSLTVSFTHTSSGAGVIEGVLTVQGGISGEFYYIKPIEGNQIKNGTGQLTVEAHHVNSAGDTHLASGTIQLFDPLNQAVTAANGYVAGSDGYTGILNADNIDNSKVITLKNGAGGDALDTITLVDVADGSAGSSAMNVGRANTSLEQWYSDIDQTQTLGTQGIWEKVQTGSPPIWPDSFENFDPGASFPLNVFSERMVIDVLKRHRMSIYVKQDAGDHTHYLFAAFYDAAGDHILGTNGGATGWTALGSFHYWIVTNAAFPTSWTNYTFEFGGSAVATIPAAAVTCAIGILPHWTGTTDTTSNWQDYFLAELGGDGVYGFIEPENGLAWSRAIDAGTWTPAVLTTDFDCTFVQGGNEVARAARRITLTEATGVLTVSGTGHKGGDKNVGRVSVDLIGDGTTAVTVQFNYSFEGVVAKVSETVKSVQGGDTGPDGPDGPTGPDGDDAVTHYLTNEAHVVSADSAGAGYSLTGAGGTHIVSDGLTDVTTTAVHSVIGGATKNGLTIAVVAGTGVYSLSGASWTTDDENFTLRAVYGAVNYDRVYSITKAKQGGDGSVDGVAISNHTVTSSTITPTNALAEYQLTGGGIAQKRETGTPSAFVGIESWLKVGQPGDYEVECVPGGTDAADVTGPQGVGTWSVLSTGRLWTLPDTTVAGGSKNATLALSVRHAVTEDVIDTATITMSADKGA